MLAAVSSPVVSNPVHSSLVPSSFGRRQQRQRLLAWEGDEPADRRRLAITRSAANADRGPVPPTAPAGPRRMADVMPAVLARYGL